MAGPVGPERLDQLVALLASVIANVNRSKKTRPYKPEQFLPKWDQPAQAEQGPQTGEDHLRLVKALHKQMSRG